MEITSYNRESPVNFVSFTSVSPTVRSLPNRALTFRRRIQQPQEEVEPWTAQELTLDLPQELAQPIVRRQSVNGLISKDIEDIFRQAGLTTINGKQIKFGSRELRAQNASYGARNSNHKRRDPHTGYSMARDISIIGGNLDDYAEFRRQIMSNDLISQYLDAKNWGIINEVTPQILSRTRGTGLHFHFGPDTWARRTWSGWRSNPDIPITTAL